MNIGEAIKYIRKRKAIKQYQLAELAGISVNELVGIEKGRFFPSMDTINGICKALNISKGCLLVHSLEESELPPQKNLYQYLVKPLQEELWEEQQ